jgi:hypothetical protein
VKFLGYLAQSLYGVNYVRPAKTAFDKADRAKYPMPSRFLFRLKSLCWQCHENQNKIFPPRRTIHVE